MYIQYLSSCIVLWKSFWLSSATKGPEQGHVRLIALVATEPHLLHLMSCSWYRTLSSRAKQGKDEMSLNAYESMLKTSTLL